jgi:DNA-directed RNA polymerase II subunit RPB2
MPYTKDGIRPEIIVNPHAIPSRMTIGQLYESQTGNYCAMKGTHSDATIFKYVDIESMGNELEAMGMHRYGYHRLYSGITGEFIDCMIFMGPTYYQRLQKFVIDAVYSISQGPSDVLSRQPLDGKASGGGIRVGEINQVSVMIKVMASLHVAGNILKLRERLNLIHYKIEIIIVL